MRVRERDAQLWKERERDRDSVSPFYIIILYYTVYNNSMYVHYQILSSLLLSHQTYKFFVLGDLNFFVRHIIANHVGTLLV